MRVGRRDSGPKKDIIRTFKQFLSETSDVERGSSSQDSQSERAQVEQLWPGHRGVSVSQCSAEPRIFPTQVRRLVLLCGIARFSEAQSQCGVNEAQASALNSQVQTIQVLASRENHHSRLP